MSNYKIYQALYRQKKDLDKQKQALLKGALVEVFSPFFDKFPTLKTIAWNQYRESFNDSKPSGFTYGYTLLNSYPEFHEEAEDEECIREEPEDVEDLQWEDHSKIEHILMECFDPDDIESLSDGDSGTIIVTRTDVRVESYDPY